MDSSSDLYCVTFRFLGGLYTLRSLRMYIIIGFCALSLLFLAISGVTQVSAKDSHTSASPDVRTIRIIVRGRVETVLTDSRGWTLYYYTPDSRTRSACTGRCAVAWPPFISRHSLTRGSGINGTLRIVRDGNGEQVQYDGHFLYTYAGDHGPRRINGEGREGKWFVATSRL
jgi:predicted lipoprotein with Yx(FWY)xxD motif